ncbi:MFS transporter, partial [Streptomyces sp. NPDC056121]|uniref:MFS transporter n=1 Tax=Streptomyces sp. NPDC056121 TaxID=3345718 RepID=UPI0035DD7E55
MSPSASTAPGSAARANRLALLVVGLCWLVVFFDGLDMFVYGSVLPHMLETKALGISPGKAGDVGSYATFGMLIGALCSGTLSDRVGRKQTIIASTAVFSLASALCATAGSLDVFSIGRFVAGLGLGGLLPSAITLVAEYAPRGRRALIVGSLMTAHQAGGILAGFVALWTDSDWRLCFWICVVPLFIGVPLAARYLPESLAFLQTKGRTAEAAALADRYGVELDAPGVKHPAREGWGALAALFRGKLWIQTLCFWLASFGGLLLVYG